jgi:hypothetical protein
VVRHIDDRFAALLSPRFRVADLEGHPASVFGMWRDTTLAYVNPAWSAFAESNNGQPAVEREWGLGARYLDAIAEPLQPFYERLLQEAPGVGMSLRPASHTYECSSADVFRRFVMQVYCLPERSGFVVVNSLVVEAPHDPAARPAQSPDAVRYMNTDGVIVQCSHCRRIRHAGADERWDWVPEWVEHSPRDTSHGLCPICFEYYYPDVAA